MQNWLNQTLQFLQSLYPRVKSSGKSNEALQSVRNKGFVGLSVLMLSCIHDANWRLPLYVFVDEYEEISDVIEGQL